MIRFLFPALIGLIAGFLAATLHLDFFSMAIAGTVAAVVATLAAGNYKVGAMS